MNHDAGRAAGPAMSEPLTAEETLRQLHHYVFASLTISALDRHRLLTVIDATLAAARPSGEVDARSFTRWFLSQPYERRQAFLRENGAARPSGEDVAGDGWMLAAMLDDELRRVQSGLSTPETLRRARETYVRRVVALDGRREEGA